MADSGSVVADASGEKGAKRKFPFEKKRSEDALDPSLKKKKMDPVASTSAATEIKVVDFAACRAREIEAMTYAISHGSVNHRIYQRLPKHMRRRAMSHDPKRMPRRLRAAHIQELEKSKTKPVSKRPSRRYRRRPKNLLSEYERRKRRVMWLETHIWHAKRFHMVEKWGYKIPHYPNDKGIRAAHRAVSKYCLLHDLSFMCCIEMVGTQEKIIGTISRLSNKATGLSVGAKSFINGTRQGTVTLYQQDSYPYKVIGPAKFIWKPNENSSVSNTNVTEGKPPSPMETDVQQERRLWLWVHPACYQLVLNELRVVLGLNVDVEMKGKCTKKTQAESEIMPLNECDRTDETSSSSGALTDRPMMESDQGNRADRKKEAVDNKPSDGAFSTNELGCSSGSTSAAVQKSDCTVEKKSKVADEVNAPGEDDVALQCNPSFSNDGVKVVSLKDELVRFRLTGPLSQAILVDLLCVAEVENETTDKQDLKWWERYYSKAAHNRQHLQQKALWDMMKRAEKPSDCCSNAVISLTVRDPRVFLPKKKKCVTVQVQQAQERLPMSSEDALNLCRPYPAEVNMSPIWDETIRKQTNDKMTTHELNSKRSELLVPGTDLHLGREESRIPVLLLQNPGTTSGTINRTDHSLSGYGSGWDLVVPAGWGMAFWLGLIFRGARASGLREFNSTSMEMRTLCFPRDYPDGEPGKKWAFENQESLETKFRRHPPSKRPHFVKLNVQAPFHPPWDTLVNLWRKDNSSVKTTSPAMDSRATTSERKFYTLRDRRDLEVVSEFCNKESLAKGNKTQESVNSDTSVEILRNSEQHQTALVAVSLAMFGRGSPTEMAMICIPSQKDMDMLRQNKQYGGPTEPKVPVSKSPKAAKNVKSPQNALPMLNPENVVGACTRKVIGFLTDGKFSLVRGSGLGRGFCALQGLLQLGTLHRINGQLLVLVRDTNSFQYRFAKLTVLTDSQ